MSTIEFALLSAFFALDCFGRFQRRRTKPEVLASPVAGHPFRTAAVNAAPALSVEAIVTATSTTSVRTATPTVPDRPSALARFFAWLLPAWAFASCRWYRRATGGRWARTWHNISHIRDWHYVGWRRHATCRSGCGNALNVECTKDACKCEVYP